MKAIHFKEENCVYAENQPQYLPIPAHKTPEGVVITCYNLTFWESVRVLCGAKIWVTCLTFNKPLQPQKLSINNPI